VAEIGPNSILASANRARVAADSRRARSETRQADISATDVRTAARTQRSQVTDEISKQAAQAVADRRNRDDSERAQRQQRDAQQLAQDAAARDQRVAFRQREDQNYQLQQRRDLRAADANVQTINPRRDLPRGSIIDVSG